MQHGQTVNPNHRFLSAIRGVEMRGHVVAKVHSYDDAVESTEFRHLSSGTRTPGITSSTDLPVICI